MWKFIEFSSGRGWRVEEEAPTSPSQLFLFRHLAAHSLTAKKCYYHRLQHNDEIFKEEFAELYDLEGDRFASRIGEAQEEVGDVAVDCVEEELIFKTCANIYTKIAKMTATMISYFYCYTKERFFSFFLFYWW